MDSVPSLLDLLHASFEATPAPNEAYTVTRRVEIAPGICDVQFIDATLGAAQIYGRTVEGLIGNWMSLTHPIEAYQHARQMATSRHYHGDVPTAYIGSILRPNGSTVPVVKDTRQLHIRGTLYWLTRLRPASETPHLPDQQSIRVPDFEDRDGLTGNHSLAEIQVLLASTAKESLPYGNYSSIIGKLNSDSKVKAMATAVRQNGFAENGIRLLMGRPLQRVNSGQLLAECQRCAHVWSPQKQSEILFYDDNDILIDIRGSERCGGLSHCRNWMGDFTVQELAPIVTPLAFD